MGDRGKAEGGHAGYEYLLAYKLTVPIYDYTVEFCRRHIDPRSRTTDQMVQAARSGMQNIAEGYKFQSLQGYIKLAGVSRGSLEELLRDYHAFARQNKLTIWPKERAEGEIGEIRAIWETTRATPVLPDHPDFPDLPRDREVAVNLMITLINQANYLLDKLIRSLEEKFAREGGKTEQRFRRRLEQRQSGETRM